MDTEKSRKYLLWLTVLLISLAVILTSGCQSDKIKFNYPSDIVDMCIEAREAAKTAIIEKCDTPLKLKKGCTVVKQPGEVKVGGMWAWQFEPFGLVGGLCYGTKIVVGCHPETQDEVSYGVLYHENGHYWLMTNYDDASHDPKFDPAFGWSGSSVRMTNLEAMTNSIRGVVFRDSKTGEYVHADVLSLKK